MYAGSSPAFVMSLIESAFLLATYDSCLGVIRWNSGKKEPQLVPLFCASMRWFGGECSRDLHMRASGPNQVRDAGSTGTVYWSSGSTEKV